MPIELREQNSYGHKCNRLYRSTCLCGNSRRCFRCFDVISAFNEEFEKRGLKSAKVIERPCKTKGTGCRGLCARDVLVDVLIPGQQAVTYEHVTPVIVHEIVDKHNYWW